MSAAPVLVSTGITDVGARRSLNEDAYFRSDSKGLWAVADGMGGHSAGDFASAALVQALDRVEHPSSPRGLLADIVTAVEGAHSLMRTEAARVGTAVIGSTLVCLARADGARTGLVIWCGDSRAYRLRGGEITRLTRDHSVVQDLVDAGQLTEEEAETHPHSHMLARAVGASDDLDLDFEPVDIAPGDRFLLCSDGLSRCVPDAHIAALATGDDPQEACAALLARAYEAGAPDNVTILIVRAEQEGRASS